MTQRSLDSPWGSRDPNAHVPTKRVGERLEGETDLTSLDSFRAVTRCQLYTSYISFLYQPGVNINDR